MELKQLSDMYLHEVQDLLSAEKQILEVLPKVAEMATSGELKASLEMHRQQTEGQRDRLIKAIEMLGKEPHEVECKGMKGLLQEGQKLAQQTAQGPLRDLAIIGASRKVEQRRRQISEQIEALRAELGEEEVELRRLLEVERLRREQVASDAGIMARSRGMEDGT